MLNIYNRLKNSNPVVSELFSKTLTIGFVTFFSKLIILIIPYLLEPQSYNIFNKNYYSLSLVIILSGFGFEFSYQRGNISFYRLILLLTGNIIVTQFILIAAGVLNFDVLNFLLITIASLISVLISIAGFTLLFRKSLKGYVMMSLLFHSFVIVTYLVLRYFESDPFRSYIIALIAAFIIAFALIKKALAKEGNEYLNMYAFGLNALIINGFFAVVMSINHILAGNLLSHNSANNIILVWLASVPLIYLSNIFEKVVYNSVRLKDKIVKWVLINFSLMLFYTLVIGTVILVFDFLLPSPADKELMSEYMVLIFPGILIFALLNSFINAYTFRYLDYKRQSIITVIYAALLIICVLIAILSLNKIFLLNDLSLIIFSGSVLLTAIISKSVIVLLRIKSIAHQ